MPFAFNKLDVSDDEASQDEGLGELIDDISDMASLGLGRREPLTQRSTTRIQKKKVPRKLANKRILMKHVKNRTSSTKAKAPAKVMKAHLNIGLDFGTTYSGSAWVSNLEEQGNDIAIMNRWPDVMKHGSTSSKMPTRIAYAEENKRWGPGKKKLARDVIGFEVLPGMKQHTCFKLRLDDRADPTEYDDPYLSSAPGRGLPMLPAGKSAVDVAADFLRIFRKIIIAELEKTITKATLKTLPIKWWVTMPAIWDDTAQHNTLAALRQAGFYDRAEDRSENRVDDEVFPITEPEAAAVAALKKTHAQNPSFLKVGTRMLILDIGGGTIDGECMKIKSLAPWSIEAIGVGQGGKSGSTSIDRRFFAFMMHHFGELLRDIPDTKKDHGSKFMDDFEREKKGFRGNVEDSISVPFDALAALMRSRLKTSEYLDDEYGEVIVPGVCMAEFFSQTIVQATKLIQHLVTTMKELDNQRPNIVVLAGGLSGSDYVFEQIEEFCKRSYGSDMHVLRPDDTWGAIAYGAVMCGMDRTLTISRTARRYYAIVVQTAFREGIDPEDRAVYCPIGGKRLGGALTILLRKGERISESNSRYTRGYVPVTDFSPDGLKSSFKIYCSKKDKPPKWEDDEGVFYMGDINIDLKPCMKVWGKQGHWAHDAASEPVRQKLNIVVRGGHGAGIMHIQANAMRGKVGESTIDYSVST